MKLGKVTMFVLAMGVLLSVALAILASFAPTDPSLRHIFEIGLVIIGVGWIAALLIGTRRIMWTGKLF